MLTQLTNQYKFDDPERVVASNMINILDRDDEVFGIQSTLPDFVYTVEKSQYQAISEEMLKFFAGVIDFNKVAQNRKAVSFASKGKFFKKDGKTANIAAGCGAVMASKRKITKRA